MSRSSPSFGIATIGGPLPNEHIAIPPLVPARRLASTCEGRRYDCGQHGTLSVKEIADLVGTSKTAIYKRLAANVRGEALCSRRWARQSEVRRESPPRRHTLAAAFKLAVMYPDHVPTVKEIQAFRPMSRQNAQCWRQAIATARRGLLKDVP
jgi:hypothetical protein